MGNRFRVGELEVIVVSDGEIRFPGVRYFRGSTEAQWKKHDRWLDHEGNVVFPYACFLVRSGHTSVLIDTGVGPVVTGPFKGGELIADLASEGIKPEDVDAVFLTHLHIDHCGTAAVEQDGEMRPAFPNARYYWTAAEEAHWLAEAASPYNRTDIFEAVRPRWEARDGGQAVAPGIDVIALPGHTPGHAGVVLSSGDERAFILGDAISCPAQLEEPEWSGLGDIDPKLARQSQEAVAREAEASGALFGAAHFPGLTFGRVLRANGRRYWQAV